MGLFMFLGTNNNLKERSLSSLGTRWCETKCRTRMRDTACRQEGLLRETTASIQPHDSAHNKYGSQWTQQGLDSSFRLWHTFTLSEVLIQILISSISGSITSHIHKQQSKSHLFSLIRIALLTSAVDTICAMDSWCYSTTLVLDVFVASSLSDGERIGYKTSGRHRYQNPKRPENIY